MTSLTSESVGLVRDLMYEDFHRLESEERPFLFVPTSSLHNN